MGKTSGHLSAVKSGVKPLENDVSEGTLPPIPEINSLFGMVPLENRKTHKNDGEYRRSDEPAEDTSLPVLPCDKPEPAFQDAIP